MNQLKKLCGRIRLKYRRGSTLLGCVVLTTILLSVAALVVLNLNLSAVRQDTEAQRQQAIVLEQENRRLRQKIAQLGSVKSLRQIATEELGLVDPDSEFFATHENAD